MIKTCECCGQYVDSKPRCTICKQECNPRVHIAFDGPAKKKYSVCYSCWVNGLSIYLREARKKFR